MHTQLDKDDLYVCVCVTFDNKCRALIFILWKRSCGIFHKPPSLLAISISISADFNFLTLCLILLDSQGRSDIDSVVVVREIYVRACVRACVCVCVCA